MWSWSTNITDRWTDWQIDDMWSQDRTLQYCASHGKNIEDRYNVYWLFQPDRNITKVINDWLARSTLQQYKHYQCCTVTYILCIHNATKDRKWPVITQRCKILAERINRNSLNKAFVLREHPQFVTYMITTVNISRNCTRTTALCSTIMQRMSDNDLRQVAYTLVPMSPSSKIWYRSKGSNALWQCITNFKWFIHPWAHSLSNRDKHPIYTLAGYGTL